MEPAENNKENLVKKPKKRVLKIIIATLFVVLLVLILAIVFALPAYVSSDSGKRFILAKANASGSGALDFAKLSMSWGNGINISSLSFRDKAESMSVAVKGFSTMPNYGALLTGNLSLGRTLIDEPKIEINVDKMKQKPAEKPRPETKTGAEVGLPIGRIDLVVKNGDVKITGASREVDISQINSSVNLRPEGEKTDFNIGAKVAGGSTASTINAKGTITPGRDWDLKKTSGDVTVEVNNLDLASLESILAIAGVEVSAKGVVSGDIKGAIKDGMIETVNCDVKGRGLEITAPALKTDKIKTSILDLDVSARRTGDLMNVEKLTVQTDWLKADANGAAPTSLGALEDFLKPDSKYELRANLECDIPALTAQLPTTLGLKEGMKVTGGKLVGDVQTLSEGGIKKLSGQVSIDGLAGTFNGKPLSISEPIRVQALITTDGKVINFEKAGITSAFANVNCTGTTESFGYDAQIDLARLAGELGPFADLGKYKLEGQVASKGKISNNAKTKTTMVVSSSNIANLKVSPTADITITEPNASIEVIAAVDNAAKVLLVKQLKAGTSIGQYSIKDGRIPTSKESKEPMSLMASAKGVDLSRLQPYLVMTKAISKDVQLGGVAESDMTVGYSDGSYKLKTESTKITNLMVKTPDKQPFTQDTVALVLDADVNPATSNWSLEMEVTGTNIKIKGNFKQNTENQTSNMQGNAQLDYDWKVLSGMLSAFMPSGLAVEGKRKDAISFSSRYPKNDVNQMLANLDAQAKVGFDKAGYMGLNIGATNVDIKVDKGFLTIPPFTATVNNGQFNFGGSADFKKKPAMFRTPGPMAIVKNVQLNDEMMNKLLGKVNPVFLGALNTSGTANFDCNKLAVPISGGRPEDTDIAGTISLTQVKMQPTGLLGLILTAIGAQGGQVMTIHPTPFVVNNGFVRYENMQMDIGNMPVNFAGAVPLDPDRQIENFSVVLPVSDAGKIVIIGKETETPGQEPQRITAYIKGTPKHPQLDLGKIVQDQLIEKGLELLLEKPKKKK